MKNVISTWTLFLRVKEVWAFEMKLDLKEFLLDKTLVFG
jgi:hypothetical protein